MAYAQALVDWGDVGGYEWETLWDVCTVAALGMPFDRAQWRDVSTLSGGEQKRLVLEALLRGPDEVLLLDEPDNYLDVPAKRWLEEPLIASPKTVLFVSHDRELLDRVATRVATLEPGGAGSTLWVHPGRFSTYHQAREDRNARLEELRRRWDEEHQKLKALVQMLKDKAKYNDGMAPRYHAAQTRLRKFEEAGPPEETPSGRRSTMRLAAAGPPSAPSICRAARAHRSDEAVRHGDLVRRAGGRPGQQRIGEVALPAAARRGGATRTSSTSRSVTCSSIPWRTPGRRAGIAGPAGLVRPDPSASRAAGPHAAGDPAPRRRAPDRTPREEAARALDRYGLARAASRPSTLSGGQQARFQILLLELSGATCCCWTSRPTTSTCTRPRRWRRGSRRSRARSSR